MKLLGKSLMTATDKDNILHVYVLHSADLWATFQPAEGALYPQQSICPHTSDWLQDLLKKTALFNDSTSSLITMGSSEYQSTHLCVMKIGHTRLKCNITMRLRIWYNEWSSQEQLGIFRESAPLPVKKLMKRVVMTVQIGEWPLHSSFKSVWCAASLSQEEVYSSTSALCP